MENMNVNVNVIVNVIEIREKCTCISFREI